RLEGSTPVAARGRSSRACAHRVRDIPVARDRKPRGTPGLSRTHGSRDPRIATGNATSRAPTHRHRLRTRWGRLFLRSRAGSSSELRFWWRHHPGAGKALSTERHMDIYAWCGRSGLSRLLIISVLQARGVASPAPPPARVRYEQP